MGGFLPTVDILADFDRDQDRALWLLNASDGMIVRDYSAIRAVLLAARFQLGLDCLDVRHSALNSVRDDRGELKPHLVELLEECRAMLRQKAYVPEVAGAE